MKSADKFFDKHRTGPGSVARSRPEWHTRCVDDYDLGPASPGRLERPKLLNSSLSSVSKTAISKSACGDIPSARANAISSITSIRL